VKPPLSCFYRKSISSSSLIHVELVLTVFFSPSYAEMRSFFRVPLFRTTNMSVKAALFKLSLTSLFCIAVIPLPPSVVFFPSNEPLLRTFQYRHRLQLYYVIVPSTFQLPHRFPDFTVRLTHCCFFLFDRPPTSFLERTSVLKMVILPPDPSCVRFFFPPWKL